MTARSDDDRHLTRALGLSGIAWGAALLVAGPSIWRRVDDAGPDEVDRIALKLLGARHVATGAAQVLLPGSFQRLEIGVDLVHAATMVGVAVLDPPRRRPALVTTAVALASAVAGIGIRRRAARSRT
jgi:hypothetical protein